MRPTFVLIALLITVPVAHAAKQCPAGTVEIAREDDGRRVVIRCRAIDDLTLIDIETLPPGALSRLSADDRKQINRMKAGESGRYPSLDGTDFSEPWEIPFARRELDRLKERRRKLETARKALEGEDAKLRDALRDNDRLTRELLIDSQGQTLSYLQSLVSLSLRAAPLPEPERQALMAQFEALFTTAIGVNDARQLGTADAKAQIDKGVDSAAAIKNLLLSHPGVFSGAEGERTKAATDGVTRILKIMERRHHGVGDWRDDIADLGELTIDLTAALAPPAGDMAKAGKSYFRMVANHVAWKDLDDTAGLIDRARNGNVVARDYYNGRLAQVDRLEDFYRDRLRRAERKARR